MAWFYLDFFVKEEQKKPRDENLRMIVANVFHVSVFDHLCFHLEKNGVVLCGMPALHGYLDRVKRLKNMVIHGNVCYLK